MSPPLAVVPPPTIIGKTAGDLSARADGRRELRQVVAQRVEFTGAYAPGVDLDVQAVVFRDVDRDVAVRLGQGVVVLALVHSDVPAQVVLHRFGRGRRHVTGDDLHGQVDHVRRRA